ncbi:MAG: Flp family type IVb pilin [Alphaproteobacteria bacterium]|nr:Flp family type IVb pilin [Alphaproteobacteria bacterium]
MQKLIKAYLRDENGATAIEYGLIVAGLSIVILATVLLLGGTLDANFLLIQSYLVL